MEFKALVLLCLNSFIVTAAILFHNFPTGRARLMLNHNQNYGHIENKPGVTLLLNNGNSLNKERSTPTSYRQSTPTRVSFIPKNSANNPPNQLQLFPGFERTRRSGWSSWGINLMNQYLGSGGWGQSQPNFLSQGNSQAAAISKVIVTKAKLLRQMLELKRISTNKFVEGILFLNRLKNGNQHYQYSGIPATVAPINYGHGWQSSGSIGNFVSGQGWGAQDSKAASFRNLGYTIGSSLAGVSKFAKIVGNNGYNTLGTEHWPTTGFGHTTTVVDHYPTYGEDNGKGQFNHAGQNTGLKTYPSRNPTRPSSNGYGYNYGDGNEYSGIKSGWSESPPSTFGGGGTTGGGGGSGSGDSFVYEEGGNEITSGLRVPSFKPISTKK